MQITTNHLDFVTIEGLLAYGERFAERPHGPEVQLPAVPAASNERANRAYAALDAIRLFVRNAQSGLSGAEAYREARTALLRNAVAAMISYFSPPGTGWWRKERSTLYCVPRSGRC